MGHRGPRSEPADELTEEQVEALRADLLQLQQELAQLLAASADGAEPVDLSLPIGRVSRVDAMQQQSMRAASRQAARLRQQQVSAALMRVEEGDYGLCQSCEEPIAHRRLLARPEAALCIGCQSRRESTG
jgi:DnaK suppressor protein